MDKADFVEVLKKGVLEETGLQSKIIKVQKNNGLELTGLSIPVDGTVSKTFYLDGYFEKYCNGLSPDSCLHSLIRNILENEDALSVDISRFADYEWAKDKLVYKLINSEMNREVIKDIPHERFLNFEKVYSVLLDMQGDTGTVLVKNKHLELWNVSQEDMTAQAEKNTELLLPAEITPLMDIVTKVLPMETGEAMPLFVSTNNRKLFGAGTILYHNLLSDFLKMQKSDYCILLPSSIHEMLLMPCESKPSKEEIRKLEKTVRTVNKEQVAREELLSDNVYLYDREQDKIKIA